MRSMPTPSERGGIALTLLVTVTLGCTASHEEYPSDSGHRDVRSIDEAACSPCRAKTEEECRADLRCEAIPRWGNPIMSCPEDERGFSCIWVGCRKAGMRDVCPSLDEVAGCAACGPESLPVDEQGCRPCASCEDGFVDRISHCAIENLCREEPGADRCR
jgi:hypothetical protein